MKIKTEFRSLSKKAFKDYSGQTRIRNFKIKIKFSKNFNF